MPLHGSIKRYILKFRKNFFHGTVWFWVCLTLPFMTVSCSPVVVWRRRRLSLLSLVVSVFDFLYWTLLVLSYLSFLLGDSFRRQFRRKLFAQGRGKSRFYQLFTISAAVCFCCEQNNDPHRFHWTGSSHLRRRIKPTTTDVKQVRNPTMNPENVFEFMRVRRAASQTRQS